MHNDSPERRHLRLVTNDELRDLIQSRNSNGFVNMLHPLELYIPREVLNALTRDSLQALRTQTLPNATDAEKAQIERGIQQRVDFISWLQGQGDEHIYMAIYPAALDGLDDLEELEEIIDDLPPDMPF